MNSNLVESDCGFWTEIVYLSAIRGDLKLFINLQRGTKRLVPGWENFLAALAYLLCLALPGSCLAIFTNILVHLCTGPGKRMAPRLQEFFRPGQAEVVSNSKNKILATWEPFFRRALYIMCCTPSGCHIFPIKLCFQTKS